MKDFELPLFFLPFLLIGAGEGAMIVGKFNATSSFS
jgi:hypothetical protein